MKLLIFGLIVAAAIATLPGCTTTGSVDPAMYSFDQGSLPPPDITLKIPGLGPCTDNPDRALHLNSQEPVTVLVHGCYGSSGLFRGFAQVLAFHGHQTVCFTYNYRDSLMKSSSDLITALNQLAQSTNNKQITVIGHSQGGMITRKAMVTDRPDTLENSGIQARLVTISAPFAGIAAANACANQVTRKISLGLVGLLCKALAGDKWSEIVHNSVFVREPGSLNASVQNYLKIDTDERGSCRRFEDNRCVESDYIFSLEEQIYPPIDDDPLADVVKVKAGHVEIVGDKRIAPVKLIALLQQSGIMNATEPHRVGALNLLLAKVYHYAD